VADLRTDEQRDRDPRGDNRRTSGPNDTTPDLAGVRDDDLEPHAGLRYVARLFKVLALLILLLLIAEIVIQLWRAGLNAVPTLLVDATQMIVLGALLWGAGDLALMLIESNHDLRATRILVGRLNGKVQRLEAMSFGPPPARPGAPAAPAPRPGAVGSEPPFPGSVPPRDGPR
jgi:hypothetical protein